MAELRLYFFRNSKLRMVLGENEVSLHFRIYVGVLVTYKSLYQVTFRDFPLTVLPTMESTSIFKGRGFQKRM
jgi:hypothetical protein